MNRGARRYGTFIDDEDCRSFLRLLFEVADRHDVRVACFCLMGNHFHLVLHCRVGGLSPAMRDLTSRYTRTFNRDHGFDGPLFRSRFRSVLIESDAQLLTVARYVHRNPLDVGVHPARHPWSSYGAYLDPRQTNARRLRSEVVLGLEGGPEAHRRSVETDRPGDSRSISLAIGTTPPAPRVRSTRSMVAAVDAAVAAVVEDEANPDLENRTPNSDPARLAAIWLAAESGRVPTSTIASHYGLSSAASARAAVSRARRRRESRPGFAHLCDRALAIFESRPAARL